MDKQLSKNHLSAILSLEKITYWYEQPDGTKTFIFRDVTRQFLQGTSYAITGPSGCGKSTLLHLLTGLLRPQQGLVLYNQKPIPIGGSVQMAWWSTQMGIMLQQPLLLPEYTVIENIMIKDIVQGKACDTAQAYHLLHMLGLAHYDNSSVWQLSGGQQQRVALARALYGTPAFVIADEPTAALDEEAGTQLIHLLTTVCNSLGVGLIVATHDEAVQQAMDHLLIIERQQVHSKNINS